MFDIRVIPDPILMILQLTATLLLYFILRHFLYKPVSEYMNGRKERIQDDIDDAKVLKEDALSLKNEYEVKITDAKKEGQEIIEASRKRGEEIRRDIVDEGKKEAEGILNRARKEIDIEKEKALDEIKLQAGEMALLIASKVIDENLDVSKQKYLIDKFINEVGESKWQS